MIQLLAMMVVRSQTLPCELLGIPNGRSEPTPRLSSTESIEIFYFPCMIKFADFEMYSTSL